jgi:hypothetical protein
LWIVDTGTLDGISPWCPSLSSVCHTNAPTSHGPPPTLNHQVSESIRNAECHLGPMIIKVKLSHWRTIHSGSGRISGLGKVLVEISTIRNVHGHALGFPALFDHTLLPTISSASTQLHIIKCGRDESLPYVNLQGTCLSDLSDLLS